MYKIRNVPEVGCCDEVGHYNDFVVASGGGSSNLPPAVEEKINPEK
jgi:hypothetical protein